MVCTITKMNDINGSLNIMLKVLDIKNWNQWSIQMHVLFGVQHVLDLINEGYTPVVENETEAQRNMQVK